MRATATGSDSSGIQAKQSLKNPGSLAWQSLPGVSTMRQVSQTSCHSARSPSQLASRSHRLQRKEGGGARQQTPLSQVSAPSLAACWGPLAERA